MNGRKGIIPGRAEAARARDAEWVTILAYPSGPGRPRPQAALDSWLRARGVDYLPDLADDDVRIDLMLTQHPDGRYCDVLIRVRAGALRRLGLHPGQSA